MQQRITSLQESLDKKVSVDWREEVRKDTFVNHHHLNIRIKLTTNTKHKSIIRSKKTSRNSFHVNSLLHAAFAKV